MKLIGVSFEKSHARLEFEYKNNHIHMLEIYYSKDNSDARFSDCVGEEIIYNEWMNKSIPIKENQNGEDKEYFSYFEVEKACYYFHGVMDKKEFINIIENLSLDK